MLRGKPSAFALCACVALLPGMAAAPRDFPPDFHFGVARDAQLTKVPERVRKGQNPPALAAISMTSTGTVELAAAGLRGVGFRERVTTNDPWHLGSITTPMTATFAARLVETGCITWNARLTRVVPQLYPDGSTARWYACLTLAPDVDFAVFAACNAVEETGERASDQAAWALIQRYFPGKGRLD